LAEKEMDIANFGIVIKNDETGSAALDARPGDVNLGRLIHINCR
jgi:hypothetical protein